MLVRWKRETWIRRTQSLQSISANVCCWADGGPLENLYVLAKPIVDSRNLMVSTTLQQRTSCSASRLYADSSPSQMRPIAVLSSADFSFNTQVSWGAVVCVKGEEQLMPGTLAEIWTQLFWWETDSAHCTCTKYLLVNQLFCVAVVHWVSVFLSLSKNPNKHPLWFSLSFNTELEEEGVNAFYRYHTFILLMV